jgi:hypothetical protein
MCKNFFGYRAKEKQKETKEKEKLRSREINSHSVESELIQKVVRG